MYTIFPYIVLALTYICSVALFIHGYKKHYYSKWWTCAAAFSIFSFSIYFDLKQKYFQDSSKEVTPRQRKCADFQKNASHVLLVIILLIPFLLSIRVMMNAMTQSTTVNKEAFIFMLSCWVLIWLLLYAALMLIMNILSRKKY